MSQSEATMATSTSGNGQDHVTTAINLGSGGLLGSMDGMGMGSMDGFGKDVAEKTVIRVQKYRGRKWLTLIFHLASDLDKKWVRNPRGSACGYVCTCVGVKRLVAHCQSRLSTSQAMLTQSCPKTNHHHVSQRS